MGSFFLNRMFFSKQYNFLLIMQMQISSSKIFKRYFFFNTYRPDMPQKLVSRVFRPNSGLSVGAQVGIAIGTTSVVGILFVVIFLCCGAEGAACFCEVLKCLLCCCGGSS